MICLNLQKHLTNWRRWTISWNLKWALNHNIRSHWRKKMNGWWLRITNCIWMSSSLRRSCMAAATNLKVKWSNFRMKTRIFSSCVLRRTTRLPNWKDRSSIWRENCNKLYKALSISKVLKFKKLLAEIMEIRMHNFKFQISLRGLKLTQMRIWDTNKTSGHKNWIELTRERKNSKIKMINFWI